MRRVALVVGAVAALAFPAGAFAHASLEHTWPSFRQRVETAPSSVRLNFDQAVTVVPGSVSVYSAGGTVVSSEVWSVADKHTVVTPVRKLRKGPYTVRWHVVSSDGHVVSGVYTFGVRYPAPPPT